MMAKDHWQIYNWTPDQNKFVVGGVETLLVEDAPPAVVKAALEARECDWRWVLWCRFKRGRREKSI